MVTFREVAQVAVGDNVTSAQMIQLAGAINDRIRSGLGDPTRRIHFYMQAMGRQIRNPDSGGTLFPKVDELRMDYEHIEPSSGAEWPLTGPGDPEGINVSSILGGFVFGSESGGFDSEDLRLSDPVESGGVDMDYGTGSALDLWELGKRQRGAIDVTAGIVASPASKAAQSHFAIIQSARSPHGNAYGGYQPVPEVLGDCGDGTSDTEATPWVQLIFTPLVDGLPTLTYEGYCSANPDHVAAVLYYPGDRYEIYQYSGALTVLDWEDYVEGPYAFGSRLTKTWGNHLNRVLNFMASEYRGTDAQRAEEDDGTTPWLSHAFTTHEFLTTQYHLAPARGVAVSASEVSVSYPRWLLQGATSYPAGQVAPRSGAPGTTWATEPGFLCTAVLVYAQKLAASATVEIRDGTTLLKRVTITPDPVTGKASAIATLTTARAVSALKFSCPNGIAFTGTGSDSGLLCEATELWDYKPRLHDLALVLRLTGARIEPYRGTDGSGLDEDQAKEIGEDYFANGVVVNRRLAVALPGSLGPINGNAVFDSARRFSRRCSRLVPRENLVGYEVGADGKSVLYFRRLWNATSDADVFDGIGPRRTALASGEIQWGRTYRVSGGNVTYNGQTFAADAEFDGVQNVGEYEGPGEVFEADGILPDAPPQGWSNEWVLDVMALIPYANLETSSWKTSAFTDYVSSHFDRCTWEHPAPKPANLSRHFGYGAKEWVAPESLPSYRYAEGINALSCADPDPTCEEARRRKLRSCPIGELPLDIESVTAITEDGEERLRVVLSGRLQHGSDAPSTIDRDLSTWDLATIQAEIESGRTAENGIREYLINQFVGGDCVGHGTQYGNAAHNSTVHLGLDVPHGACFPRIALTKLVPKPYEDDNTDADESDTPMEAGVFSQIEVYARAMVEGYVDTVSTQTYGCETGVYSVLDFSFESACFQAFGGRAFGCIQSEVTTLAPAAEVRPEKPLFHGPLPNTYPSAEIFNQFAAFWNLLTRVRLMLPLKFQRQTGNSETIEVVKMHQADGTETGCTTSSVLPGVDDKFGAVMPPAPTLSGWSDDTFAAAIYTLAIDDAACDGSGDWRLVHSRRDDRYRWALFHDDYLEAIPPSWQDMIETNGLLLGIVETQLDYYTVEETTAGLGDDCNGGADFWSAGGSIHKFTLRTDYSVECALLPTAERLIPPLPPSSVIAVGRVFDGGDLIYCNRTASGTKTVTPIEADALIIAVELTSE